MTPLTAATVKRQVLDPALEGIALNRQQERLVYDPSPEADSLAEHINALASQHPAECAEMMRLLTQLVASNQLERAEWAKPAGFGDEQVRHLRRAELDGGSQAVPTREVARALRGPLDALAEICDRVSVEQAAVAMSLAVRLPESQLLAPNVRRELGDRRTDRLARLKAQIAACNDSDAQASNPGVASQPRKQAANDKPEF